MRADSYKIAVIGGDRRQVYLAEILAERGCDVSPAGFGGSTQRERIRETAALKEARKEQMLWRLRPVFEGREDRREV